MTEEQKEAIFNAMISLGGMVSRGEGGEGALHELDQAFPDISKEAKKTLEDTLRFLKGLGV